MTPHESDEDIEIAAWEKPHAARSFLQVIWHRKAFVLLGAFIGLALGFLYHSQRAPVYQSNCQLLVIKKRASEAMPVAPAAGGLFVEDDYTATHAALLRTPLILERAVKKCDLGSLKTFENVGEPAALLAAGLTVGRDTKDARPSNIIVLIYRGPVAEDCGKVLAAVLLSYQEFLDTTYRNISDETLKLIKGARDVLKTDLAAAERDYLKFRQESPTVFKNQVGVSVETERVAAIMTERTQLEMKLNNLRQRIATLKQAIAEGKGLDVLPPAALGPAAAEGKPAATDRYVQEPLLPLILEEQKLLGEVGVDNPQVENVRKRMEKMREHLSKLSLQPAEKNPAKRFLAVLEHEAREIQLTIESSTDILDKSAKAARNLLNYETQENHFRNEVARHQLVYDGTVKRLQEIDLVRDSAGFTARALSTPGAGAKIGPLAYQDIGLVLMLGLLLGAGLAYLAEWSDKSFRSPEEVRRRLGLPIVGHIPFITPDAEAERRRAEGEVIVDPMLVTHFRPKSMAAEAYRAVRTALYFATQGAGHKVIQVTSPNKGDGKSLMIANLGVMIAQSGKRVLLIDADLRRPRLHRIFSIDALAGLGAVLTGNAKASEVVQATAAAGLSLLPCGVVPPNPSELLTAPRFKELLEAMRAEYDYVLVDTPPLLVVTDPCVVAARVDGVFLTIRLTRKGRPDAERAREILAGLHVKVFGVVVNGITRGTAGIYSPNAYDYSETYDQDEPDSEEYYDDDGNGKGHSLGDGTASPAPSARGHANVATNGASHRPSGGGGMGFLGRWWPGS
jgi:polysaccharide biosynthesis transport protein